MAMKLLVIIERGRRNYGAYSPDLPGCIATARTRAAVVRRMRAAIRFHIEGLKRRGLAVPKPSTAARILDVA